jgi:hypothetical protein
VGGGGEERGERGERREEREERSLRMIFDLGRKKV